KLVAEEWPRPTIGAGEVLLRVLGCGLCGSDIAKIVDPSTPAPLVLGHEVVGEIVALGPGVTDCAIGDRVVAAHHVPCGDCHYCRRGSESMCHAFKASNLDPGGFAEYVRVPSPNIRHALFRVPRHVTDRALDRGGGTDVLPWAVERRRDGGTVHYFASGGDTLPLQLETLYHRELTLTATYSSSPSDLAEAFRLIVAGEVSVDRLVTHRV